MNTYKGYFNPRNPQKYRGDPTNIIYRSRWELLVMQKLDAHPDVVSWSSEEIVVPYRSPIDGRIHRYFVDFVFTKINNGKKETVMAEIKPYNQTMPPPKQQKTNKRYINEVVTWGINEAKWKAAQEYCADRGWKFQIITEKELGIKF